MDGAVASTTLVVAAALLVVLGGLAIHPAVGAGSPTIIGSASRGPQLPSPETDVRAPLGAQERVQTGGSAVGVHASSVLPTGPHSAPPPWLRSAGASPSAPPPSYSGHYYVGTVYTGSNRTAHLLATNLTTPADLPQPGDFYYVIMSAWDDAGSYDQIGFTNDFGTWGLAYSYTDYCASNYYYSAGAVPLPSGTTYQFSMTLKNGTITYRVGNATSPNFWSYSAFTGGNVFEVSSMFSCTFGTTYDYTDYEEVYLTTDDLPPYPFAFTDNRVDGLAEPNWTGFSLGPPATVNVLTSGANVTIANEPYALHYEGSQSDHVVREVGDPQRNSTATITLVELVSDPYAVQVSVAVLPPGWSAHVFPSSSTSTFTATVNFTVPAGLAAGTYVLGLEALDASHTPARASFWVSELPHVSVSISSAVPTSDAGQTVNFTAHAVRGVPGYQYAWSSQPLGCPTATTVMLSCTPPSGGTWRIQVMVTDAAGYATTGVLNFSVYEDPVLTLANPQPASGGVDVGQLVTFSVSVAYGPGGFGYLWSGLPGCAAPQFATVQCHPTDAGNFTVAVRVTDANGFVVTASLPYRVWSDPSFTVANLSRTSLDVGQLLEGHLVATGGSGGDVYGWVGVPATCSASADLACAFDRAGPYTIRGSVTDSNGFTTLSSPYAVTVSAALTENFNLVHPVVRLGGWFAVDLGLRGGLGPFTYSWNGTPPGCPASTNGSWTCTPSAPGTYRLSVEGVDANHASVWANATVEVWEPLPLGGSAATWTAVIVGGGVVAVLAGAGIALRRGRSG